MTEVSATAPTLGVKIYMVEPRMSMSDACAKFVRGEASGPECLQDCTSKNLTVVTAAPREHGPLGTPGIMVSVPGIAADPGCASARASHAAGIIEDHDCQCEYNTTGRPIRIKAADVYAVVKDQRKTMFINSQGMAIFQKSDGIARGERSVTESAIEKGVFPKEVRVQDEVIRAPNLQACEIVPEQPYRMLGGFDHGTHAFVVIQPNMRKTSINRLRVTMGNVIAQQPRAVTKGKDAAMSAPEIFVRESHHTTLIAMAAAGQLASQGPGYAYAMALCAKEHRRLLRYQIWRNKGRRSAPSRSIFDSKIGPVDVTQTCEPMGAMVSCPGAQRNYRPGAPPGLYKVAGRSMLISAATVKPTTKVVDRSSDDIVAARLRQFRQEIENP
uniref:Uncharacterized protein n=1 Tax=Takifugu rubripes RNA virus TaxID=2652723 RepID=A0A6J4AGK4_9VIRU|nr:hypothetical protein [Takifugu rubripes RNA virus]